MSESKTETGDGISPIRRILTLHYLPALVAMIATIAIITFADWQMQRIAARDIRQSASEALAKIRTQLESNINGNVKLVQGYVAALETEPAMTQARFSALGDRIVKSDTPIRNVAAAPGMVVTLVYPIKGNQKSIGLDYRKNDSQRAAAMKVEETGRMLLTGPVNLVQGGQGLIARFPVINTMPDGSEHFWGIVSAVIDIEKLYAESGLRERGLSIDVAMASVRGDAKSRRQFFGSEAIFRDHPVVMTVHLGHEDWQLAAVPKMGWEKPASQTWALRLLLVLGGLIVIAPILWTARLTEERDRNLRRIQQGEDEMQALSQRLQIALETSKIGVWDFNTVTGQLIWDERMRDLYDVPLPDDKASYNDWKGALHPHDFPAAEMQFARAIETDLQYNSDFRVVCRNGEVRNIRAIGTTYTDSRGHKKIIGVNWDVTEDVRLQQDLRSAKQRSDVQNTQLEEARLVMESAAMHDALTGLPNRRYLDKIVADSQSRAGDPRLTIMHIDLDRFKDINDTLGHAAGDRILRHAAATLNENIFQGDFLARIGGDEFVIISAAHNVGSDYMELAGRLIDAISRPIIYEGHECRVGTSIGIASRSVSTERIEQLLVNADIALYEAKRSGRNRVEWFTDTLRQVAVNTKKTADEILRGLEQNEFIAYFQPQFDARTLEVVGLEALARWDHPAKGILAPDAFLKIAESLKVVSQIDSAIMNQALLQQFRLAASGVPVPKVSVNVSAQRLRDETLFSRLENLSFKPGSLSFELLESISFDGDDRELIHQIDRLKALGADIEIDDFGSGHASIVTLLKLTPRRLKIDRQLIIPLLESKSQQQLVASIIEIGRSRDIEIVAEGVETMAHAEILRDLGCHTLQGYAFARPMPPGELLGFLREKRWMDRHPAHRSA